MSRDKADVGSAAKPHDVPDGLADLALELRGDYTAARPASRQLYEHALHSLPGGNSRSQLYFPPFPFYVARSEDSTLIDVDGFRYLDLANNYTSLVHGHTTPGLTERLREQLAMGTAFGAPSPLEVDLAEEICRRVPSVERVRFTNSGTEAVLYAVRTARAATGRNEIIKAEGGYHGGSSRHRSA